MQATTETAIRAVAATDPGITAEQLSQAIIVLNGLPPERQPNYLAILQEMQETLATLTVPKQERPKPFLRVKEAAAYMACSVRYIDKQKAEGRLPYHRLGRRLKVFSRADLDEFMAKRRIDVRW